MSRLCHTRGYRYTSNPRGTNVLDEDWDNLIILDACRYDVFAECSTLPGKLEHRYSLGSATYEFIRNTFAGKRLHGTVYLGANVWYLKLKDEIDSTIFRFVDLQRGDHDVEWVDQELNVVTPATVTNHAIQLSNKYPNKRLIIHYLQPHHPFVGPTGRQDFTHQSNSLIDVVREADAGIETLRLAYRENVQAVLKEVKELLANIEGKTVITADHGEMLGERHEYVPIRDYGHPSRIYSEILTKIPWHVAKSGESKQIEEESPEEAEVDMEIVDKRLKDLGYAV